MRNRFEERIRELTQPINGQLPRPWMTAMTDPLEANVFIVGMNQSREYPAWDIPHQRHLDALFNRNGESCRGLYDETTGGRPSRSRRNIDELVARLNRWGIHDILETSVVCYSTGMSRYLSAQAHAGGARHGEEIFRYLLAEIAPAVLIVHGGGVASRMSAILGISRLQVPRSADEVCDVQAGQHLVIPIPSLAPPAFHMWSSWRDEYLDRVSSRVREKLVPIRDGGSGGCGFSDPSALGL